MYRIKYIPILVLLLLVAVYTGYLRIPKAYAINQFNTPATIAIGQPDLNTILSYRKGDYGFMDFTVYNGKLFAVDYFTHNRILVYNSFPTTNQQIPDFVIGEPSLDTINTNAFVTAKRLANPQGIAVCNGKLFEVEFTGHRVLMWNSVPTTLDTAADMVIGQPDFTSNTANNGGISAHSLNRPRYVWCDNSHLIITDSSNNRVLIWNSLPTSGTQNADVVLGQPDFVSSTANNGGISAHSISSPSGVRVYEGKLYIADTSNNRVLVWNSIPTTNNKDADLVLGQPDFVSATANNGGITAHGLNQPRPLSMDNGKLIVGDYGNNRVLIWNTIPTSSNTDASVVVGQPNMTSNTANNGGLSAATLNNPIGVFAYGGKLLIGDNLNYRALIYNTIPTTNGANADLVLGQPGFDTNYLSSPGYLDGRTLFSLPLYGIGVATPGQKVVVTDSIANRVLIFNQVPTQSYPTADVVIGQPDFTTMAKVSGTTIPVSATTLSQPVAVASNGTKLAVVDRGFNRILLYNSIPTSNNASADVVVGQPNMTSSNANNGGRSAATLSVPISVCFAGSKLVVADQSNNRILIWNSTPTSNGAGADVVLGQPNMTSGTVNNGGISASSINRPTNVYCDASRIVVVDSSNYRILIWNSIPTVSNTAADVVVGQPDFVTATKSNGGISSKSITSPFAAFSDGTRLFVGDYGRILVFNSIPTTNFAEADAVLGQADFTGNANNRDIAAANNTLFDIYGMAKNDNYLFVAERMNQRVVMYPLGPQHAAVTLPAYSTSATVSLSLAADDAKDVMISDNASFTGASWESFAASKPLTLSAGDGTKTYYVKMRDYANYEGSTFTVSTVLDSTKPTVPKVTDIGKITNIPDKSPLYYYFTDQTAHIRGTAEANSTVHFTYSGKDKIAVAGGDGKFSIEITNLPRELTEFTYYAQDPAGNKSNSRVLKLMIGEENFPAYLVSATTTPTVTPTPTETTIPTISPTQTPTPTLVLYDVQLIDQAGNVLKNTTVYLNGQKYQTDSNGKLYVQESVAKSAGVTVEVNGKKYPGNILGNTIVAQLAQTTTKKANYTWFWWLIIVILIISIFYSTRNRQRK